MSKSSEARAVNRRKPVDRLPEVADDGHVGGNAQHDLVVDPGLLQVAVGVALGIDAAVHGNADGFFGMLDLERRAIGLPAIRLLALEAVDDLLLEQAELVVDAVAVTGHAERGQRFQKAGGQTSQAAVAESGIGFAVENVVEADAETARAPRDTVPRCAGWTGCRPASVP